MTATTGRLVKVAPAATTHAQLDKSDDKEESKISNQIEGLSQDTQDTIQKVLNKLVNNNNQHEK